MNDTIILAHYLMMLLAACFAIIARIKYLSVAVASGTPASQVSLIGFHPTEVWLFYLLLLAGLLLQLILSYLLLVGIGAAHLRVVTAACSYAFIIVGCGILSNIVNWRYGLLNTIAVTDPKTWILTKHLTGPEHEWGRGGPMSWRVIVYSIGLLVVLLCSTTVLLLGAASVLIKVLIDAQIILVSTSQFSLSAAMLHVVSAYLGSLPSNVSELVALETLSISGTELVDRILLWGVKLPIYAYSIVLLLKFTACVLYFRDGFYPKYPKESVIGNWLKMMSIPRLMRKLSRR